MGAIGEPYVTRDQFKNYLGIDLAKSSMNEKIDDAINSASGEIEQYTGRQFNRAEIASTRQYEPDNEYSVTVDDFYTEADLVISVDSDGLAGWETDQLVYELYPLNGVVDGMPGWPYERIRLPEGGFAVPDKRFRGGRRANVSVTARWGWLEVPAPIKQACFLLAAQTFKLADAPFGIVGAVTNEFGGMQRIRELPQVATKLNRYVSTPILIG